MKLLKYFFSAVIIAGTYQGNLIAHASNANDTCSCFAQSQGQSAGKIVTVSGSVLHLGNKGPAQAAPGSPITVGSQISIGNNSSAEISIGGSCSISLPSNTELTISRVENVSAPICASIKSTDENAVLKTIIESPREQYGADLPAAIPAPESVIPATVASPVVVLNESEESGQKGDILSVLVLAKVAVDVAIYVAIRDDDDDDDLAGDDPATPAAEPLFEDDDVIPQ